jgi:hypothetical protein
VLEITNLNKFFPFTKNKTPYRDLPLQIKLLQALLQVFLISSTRKQARKEMRKIPSEIL